jgi:LPXTG-site transpeptidase (sortase) family protein
MALHSYNPPPHDGQPDPPAAAPDAEAATDLIRAKVARVFSDEPNARQELGEAEAARHRSKHQQFMYRLKASGKDLAAIQTEWHNYYQGLPDHEKHQVWQEFYDSQPLLTDQPRIHDGQAAAQAHAERKHQVARPDKHAAKPRKLRDVRSKQQVQAAIRHKVSAGGKLQAKHHVQSLLFGLGIGLIVLLIFLFGFFNEVVIAPFIQPSRTATSTPLIVNETVSPTDTPKVIIPKINVEIPVDYNQTTIDEAQIENALENGVVHYPTTVKPGQNGNAAIFGHSSNNIFNKGKYKFAFVLLHELQNSDTFYLTYNGKAYAYKVISKTVVEPSQVGVLGPVPGQTATATLITCDPPGTSLRRLVVVGQQISPDPSTNTEGTASAASGSADAANLPGNGPTLWGRVMSTTLGKAVAIIIITIGLVLTIRWINKPKRALQL